VLVALLNRVLAACERSGPRPTTFSPAVWRSSASWSAPRRRSAKTDETVHDVAVGAARYGGSVAKLLS